MKVILSGIFLIAIGLAANCYAAEAAGPEGAVGLTTQRARALIAAGIGLVSVVCGGLAVARRKTDNAMGKGRAPAIAALMLGVIGMLLSVVHLLGSTGFGTGGGRAGAIVALVFGLIGVSLGGRALARSHRVGAGGQSVSGDN